MQKLVLHGLVNSFSVYIDEALNYYLNIVFFPGGIAVLQMQHLPFPGGHFSLHLRHY